MPLRGCAELCLFEDVDEVEEEKEFESRFPVDARRSLVTEANRPTPSLFGASSVDFSRGGGTGDFDFFLGAGEGVLAPAIPPLMTAGPGERRLVFSKFFSREGLSLLTRSPPDSRLESANKGEGEGELPFLRIWGGAGCVVCSEKFFGGGGGFPLSAPGDELSLCPNSARFSRTSVIPYTIVSTATTVPKSTQMRSRIR